MTGHDGPCLWRGGSGDGGLVVVDGAGGGSAGFNDADGMGGVVGRGGGDDGAAGKMEAHSLCLFFSVFFSEKGFGVIEDVAAEAKLVM